MNIENNSHSTSMLPRKDQKLSSVPVSRVASAVRLTLLESPQNPSFPSTPSGYQGSSLNPLRGSTRSVAPKSLEEQEFQAKFNELDVVKAVRQFEEQIGKVSSKVSSFEGDGLDTTVSSLIDLNQQIVKFLDELDQHKQLGDKISSLEQNRDHLDQKSTKILKELIGFRNELKKLPLLPTKKTDPSESLSNLNVDEVLKYGMKLSKFTRVPPTTNGMVYQIHPNNFIWPAEDSLRRGTLAISSLKGDEIIRKELGEDIPEAVEAKKEEENDDMEVEPEVKSEPKKNSQPAKEEAAAPSLNLDLFDPEDEDSD